MTYSTNEYSASLTLWKALVDFIRTLGIGGAVVVGVINSLPEPPQDWESLKTTWPLFAVAVITAIFRAVNNYRKNSGKGPVDPDWLRKAAGMLLIGALLAGCATTGDPRMDMQRDLLYAETALITAVTVYQAIEDDPERAERAERVMLAALDALQRMRAAYGLDPLPTDPRAAVEELTDATPKS